MSDTTKVLVIGGGLAGLSASMFLAWQKVPLITIDKYPGSSPHPRAIGYTQRTMQFTRALGLADRVPEIEDGFRLRRVRIHSLAGEWYEEQPWTPGDGPTDMSRFSPVRGAGMAQDRLEPILRDKALALGADLRLSTELIAFSQTADGVVAHVRERNTGREYDIQADCMIGADGNRSMVREKLGIERHGVGHIRTMYSILLEAQLDQYLENGISQFVIDQGDFQTFLTTYKDGRWVLYYSGQEVSDPEAQKEMVRRAIGRDDIAINLINSGSWELAGLINERYSKGRVFLIGDAAHTLPPTRGGWGANTGIDDANNLAWKLASVISGRSTPALLDTYNDERQPIGQLRHDQTFARPDYQRSAGKKAAHLKDVALFGEVAMELGQLYRSSAVIGAGPDLPPAADPDQWAGQPGTLAPHLWVRAHGERTSTMYLYFNQWTILATSAAWRNAAATASARLGIPTEVLVIGENIVPDEERDAATTYGLGQGGASLVRPDGVIAWRSKDMPAEPAALLTNALAQVACAVKSA